MLALFSGKLSLVVAEGTGSSSQFSNLSRKKCLFPKSSNKGSRVDLTALTWVMCPCLYQSLWPEKWNKLSGQAEVPSWSQKRGKPMNQADWVGEERSPKGNCGRPPGAGDLDGGQVEAIHAHHGPPV